MPPNVPPQENRENCRSNSPHLRAAVNFPTFTDGQLRCIFIVPKRKGWLQPLIVTIYSLTLKIHESKECVKNKFSGVQWSTDKSYRLSADLFVFCYHIQSSACNLLKLAKNSLAGTERPFSMSSRPLSRKLRISSAVIKSVFRWSGPLGKLSSKWLLL